MKRTSLARRLARSRRGITPVIAIILLLMMTVAAAGAAYLWITKIQRWITEAAEKNIMASFRTGSFQVISSYACDENCTKDGRAAGGRAGECSASLGALQLLGADGSGFAEGEVGSSGMTRGRPEEVACEVQGHVCMLVRNTGGNVLRISDLGTSQVTYELPEDPDEGVRPLPSKYISAVFTEGERQPCCRLSDMATTGTCGASKRSVASAETFVLGFFGTFKDASGRVKRLTYRDAKDQRLLLGVTLPSGFKVSHQVVS